jgi:hypothetical protein
MVDNVDINGIKKIAFRNERFSLAFNRFLYIEEKQILGNGILINKNGNVIWDTPWKHSHSREFYVKKHNLLITNRMSRVRSLTIGTGIACLSLDTGKYLWTHWYGREMDEKYALERNLVDINLEKALEFVDGKEEFLYTRNFKVNILNGNYEYKERTNIEEGVKISESNRYIKEVHKYEFYTKRPPIKFSINSVTIDEKVVNKQGYSFKKCNDVIDKNSNLYFFATPEERNPKGILILNYSKKEKDIIKEIELPFRGEIIGVYDFFGKGIMLHEEIKTTKMDKCFYSLWFIPYEAMN